MSFGVLTPLHACSIKRRVSNVQCKSALSFFTAHIFAENYIPDVPRISANTPRASCDRLSKPPQWRVF